MQRPDDRKRRDIMKVAEAAFARLPFHEVKLEEIAAKAKIGKGTIYIYFRSKEDLLVEVLREGITDLHTRMQSQLTVKTGSSMEQLHGIVSELATFATTRPHMYRLLRTVLPKACESGLSQVRAQLVSTIVSVIERGVKRGEMVDPHPQITAQYLLGAARGVALFAPGQVDAEQMTAHAMRIFGRGLSAGEGNKR